MKRGSVVITSILSLAPCILAARPTPAQGEDNLLLNPSFEETGPGSVPTHWQSHCTGGSRAERAASDAHTGEACGHILKVADGKSHVSALVFPRINVKGGSEYTLGGCGKGRALGGGATLFLYQYTKENKWLGNYFYCRVPAETDRWTSLHHSAKVRKDCAWVQVRFEIYGKERQGEAWVDDVYFGQDRTPPPSLRRLETPVDGDAVGLSWDPPEGGAPFGYQVFRAPYPRFAPAQDAMIAFTQQTRFAERMPPGHTHYYAVSAVEQALNVSEPAFTPAMRPPAEGEMPEMVVWAAGPAKRWGPALPWPLPEESLSASARSETTVEMARGEWESVQVLVGAPKTALKNVSVCIPDKAGLDLDLRLQEYVQLGHQSRWLPDPLPPDKATDIELGMLRGWWILAHAEEGTPAGDYQAQIVATAERLPPVELTLKIKVWPVMVPRGNHYGSSFGLWGAQLAEQEKVPLGSPEYQRLYRRYWEFFLEHRMVPRGLPVPSESEEAVRWLNDERVASFSISTGAWARQLNKEQMARFKGRCQRLREKAPLNKGYVYIYDEPTESKYPEVVELCKQVRNAGRDVPVLLTEQPEPPLYGSVDIWCPNLSFYATAQKRCRERQQLGEQIWWYVCLGPPPPWPNYLLTNDPIDGRVLSWLQVKKGVQGELYWAVTCFQGDVWAKGLPARWPGDGYLCYPGRPRGLDGPVTCIRAEAIRDGKEDIELIWLLRQLAAEKGQTKRSEDTIAQAMERVCRDFTDYTKQDEDLTAARRMIMAEIVRLSSMQE